MNSNDVALAYGSVVNKAWTDPAFKSQLMSEPKAALKTLGFNVPSDVQIEVVESSPDKVYIALPPQPAQLSEGQLDAVSAGKGRPADPWNNPASTPDPKGHPLY